MPCPITRQWQCLHCGASRWIAHSKQSKVKVRSPSFTSKLLSYRLPQTSHDLDCSATLGLGGTDVLGLVSGMLESPVSCSRTRRLLGALAARLVERLLGDIR